MVFKPRVFVAEVFNFERLASNVYLGMINYLIFFIKANLKLKWQYKK